MARPQFVDGLPPKSQIFEYWKDRLFECGLFVDWGDPACWVCRFHYSTRRNRKRCDASWQQILQGWDLIPLQRCHIVPRPLGGRDDVSNLFLMCRECHDRMPNTCIADIFFEWARMQSFDARETAKWQDALTSFGIGDASLRDFERVITSEEFSEWIQGKFNLHWPQSNYAPISSRLTPATLVGLAVHYHRTNPLL
jgi:HNH endonuclease